ncbi:hypothetical protein AB0G15_05870 [Streptosporangium sp. NPDC023825]|uniref:hypothetical protein n=1 Tax=Streptosporangium sp. NPDC023825 TaxID=3154909 RepID=UPI00341B2A7C
MSDNVITVEIPKHGRYKVSALAIDIMMSKYCPASVNELIEIISGLWRDNLGAEFENPETVTTVTECLFILAELNGYGR